ncbi:MAG: type II toxin-antitoxin system RelE/ParE family toxin [Candidatus Kaiserbacteria bacterium]|nr:type II toxin-antitoxin system RelE/ParE family toxin [Candidatus Kaiserbacteria bacterium]
MKVILTAEFVSRYDDLPEKIKIKAEKQEKYFRKNPFHPSLHTEKLEPHQKEVWSIRVDRRYRIAFRFIDGDTALFLTVGPHDWIYKLKF